MPSSTSSSSAWSCQMSNPSVESSVSRHLVMNLALSHCARGLQTAGPLPLLSMRNCIDVESVIIPISPPSASTSRTICPLAMPPTAGLQLICAILFMSIVIRQVLTPSFAAARAASQPAWPPPMTRTSYLNIILLFAVCTWFYEFTECCMAIWWRVTAC